MRPLVVAGPVVLSDSRFPRTLAFRDIEFESDFEAEAACFTRLDFVGCTFRGNLALRNCRVAGDLSFSHCAFPAPSARKAAAGARLELDGTWINGRLELADVALGGSLSGEGVTCRSLKMGKVGVDGDCLLVGLTTRGDVELYETQIQGHLTPRFLRCGGLMRMKDGCVVSKDLDLAGIRIASQLDLADGRFGGIYFNGSSVGSMWIGSSGKLHCEMIWAIDSEFTSYVRMSRLTVGTAALARTMGADPREPPPLAPGAEGALATTSPPGAEPDHLAGECGTVTFRHCRFGSEVATWAPRRNDKVNGMQKDNYVAIETGLTFTDCNVAGALNLTRLRVGGRAPRQGGYVRLDRTHLRGPLLISSPLAIANRLEVLAGARARAREAFAAGPTLRYRARMRSLSMRDLSASAVELSGLDLVCAGHADEDSNVDGSLVAERTTIAGRLATYVRYAAGAGVPDKEERALVSIEGALRLRAARVGELYLAGESFRKRHACTAQTDGVVLERADIGLLRVPRIKKPDGAGQVQADDQNPNDFPVPLDLSGMTVRNWSFGEDVDPEPPVEYEDYLDFLDNDEKLHREVYKSIARSLRNSGRDEDAERILYAEEYRARWETDPHRAAGRWPPPDRQWQARNPPSFSYSRLWWLRRNFEAFERFFLHYRRNTINLLYAILFLFTLSALFVSSHPDNFELSDSSRLILEQAEGNAAQFAHGIDFAPDGGGAHPDHWGFWSSVWMAARYHVPIVSLGTRSEYVASNDNPFRFGIPGWSGRWTLRIWGFTAEDWFGLMSIFNWIMWPLLLTFALRRALRSD